MSATLCGCMEPEPRSDGTCDACGLRRAGDNPTPGQDKVLAEALVAVAVDEPEDLPRLRRVKGRKRPVRR